ncbi:hypothetical protein NCAS_0A01800 [Naumovozyma castellii]|uniref:Uncharacterized protein n=1 Tax=Naumovozyma castellii TaxID=27288 RepID=G0V5K1_NAUCA|nr:hypothetical protein NCAS_0A01800 [Naumovozyma castellii CBS 4309]CCC66738.1 hypothetical protein NCAS_0A01800 [Naumovozyma castellii CBS 4309]
MQFSNILSIITLAAAPIFAQQVSVSCETVPTGGTVEATPYSVSSANDLHNGVPMVAVIEYYKSITYVSDCNPSTITTATASIETQVFV